VINVAGLDLSVVGVALTQKVEGAVCNNLNKTKEKARDGRLVQIEAELEVLLEGVEFALIEAPTPRSPSSVISGMVQGIARLVLTKKGIPYGTLLPASLKKYATGKGSDPNKIGMALAALKRAGLEFDDDNQCDAFWLWVAANDKLGQPVFDLPALNRESLTKIKMEG